MADFREVPAPNYEYEIKKLVSAYTKAMYQISAELQRLDITDMSRASTAAALAEVVRILAELNETSTEWVTRNLPIAATDGVAATIFALGVAETIEEARNIAKFNRMNKAMVDAVIADTQSDLLAVTQNVERKVRAAVRQVTAESMRANMARGVNGRRTISRDILDGLRKKLGDSVNTGIIDAAGRRWRPEVYVDMAVRTKMREAHVEATTNEAIQRGALYGIISRHGATDACRYHEGRIIKLSPDAPGNYPTYAELRATNQIFHPNCRHVISPLRDPSKLPDSARSRAERQAELGDKAIATGKRNPQGVE
ncbi:minor capsid protein [Brevibacillus sp. SYP-B805]|uniref:phage minor capsid protein n=1 Tax=Brevibacillus sp. SYP-B805 TaxID=1578199 RepID=UPI0013EBCD21|nr:phage minor capsid protein [Brevibacillus sp. SYP-B805]NGQ95492.1 minor capsid protein [Brevibacillus sp. SYP-B805]